MSDDDITLVPVRKDPPAGKGDDITLVPKGGTKARPAKPGSAWLETAKNVGSSIVRPFAQAGIAAATFIPDIATSLSNAIASKVPMGDWEGGSSEQPDELPSSYFERQLDKVTRQPTGTVGKFAEGVSATLLTGGRAAGKLGAEAVEAGAKAVARRLAGHVEEGGMTRITSRAAEEAHNAGYVMSPSYIGKTTSKAVQAAAGGDKVGLLNSAKNQAVSDRLAKTSISLAPDQELDDMNYEKLEDEAYGAYEELGKMGDLPADGKFDSAVKAAGGRFAKLPKAFGGKSRYAAVRKEIRTYLGKGGKKPASGELSPLDQAMKEEQEEKAKQVLRGKLTAQQAIDEVRALRASARANFRAALNSPERAALAQTQRNIADALDARLKRRAEQLADKGVVPQDVYSKYEAARQQLAKIAVVRDATGPGGHIMASELVKAKRAGIKLTDGLATIANTAENFPQDMKSLSKRGEEGVFSPLDFLLGGTGVIYHHPFGAGLAVARPVARGVLGTRAAQSVMLKGAPRIKAVTRRVLRGSLVRGSEAVQEDLNDEDQDE